MFKESLHSSNIVVLTIQTVQLAVNAAMASVTPLYSTHDTIAEDRVPDKILSAQYNL